MSPYFLDVIELSSALPEPRLLNSLYRQMTLSCRPTLCKL